MKVPPISKKITTCRRSRQSRRGMENLAKAVLPRAARWTCACAFFAVGLVLQAQDTALPNTTVTTGSYPYTASGSITAGTSGTYPGAVFNVNNSAADGAGVTFTAGTQIHLEPGFHAIGGPPRLHSTPPSSHLSRRRALLRKHPGFSRSRQRARSGINISIRCMRFSTGRWTGPTAAMRCTRGRRTRCT